MRASDMPGIVEYDWDDVLTSDSQIDIDAEYPLASGSCVQERCSSQRLLGVPSSVGVGGEGGSLKGGRGADHTLDDDIESEMEFQLPLALSSPAEESGVACDHGNCPSGVPNPARLKVVGGVGADYYQELLGPDRLHQAAVSGEDLAGRRSIGDETASEMDTDEQYRISNDVVGIVSSVAVETPPPGSRFLEIVDSEVSYTSDDQSSRELSADDDGGMEGQPVAYVDLVSLPSSPLSGRAQPYLKSEESDSASSVVSWAPSPEYCRDTATRGCANTGVAAVESSVRDIPALVGESAGGDESDGDVVEHRARQKRRLQSPESVLSAMHVKRRRNDGQGSEIQICYDQELAGRPRRNSRPKLFSIFGNVSSPATVDGEIGELNARCIII